MLHTIINTKQNQDGSFSPTTIENPNELIIPYNVVDSDGVKINIYNISIADIAFVF